MNLIKTGMMAIGLCVGSGGFVMGQDVRPAGPEQGTPNVVFVLIDDLGWTDLGCFGSGFYETPNIDRLCAEGVKFTQAYAACPVCSPTRAAIMTGKYPARLDLTDFLIGRRTGKLLPAEYIEAMPLEEVTLAEAFKAAGYTTFFAGKWHLGEEERFWPNAHGFDINKGGWKAGAPSYRIKDSDGNETRTEKTFYGGYFTPYQNPHLPDGPPGEYLTDRLSDETVGFIRTHRDEPFFLYLSHYAVHNPQQAPQALIDKYEAKLGRVDACPGAEFTPEHKTKNRMLQNQPVYAAMVESVDESVGRILDELESLGLDKNTIIVFTSDNGGLSTSEGHPTSNAPLRAGKGWLYEGGIRVPLIVKCPGAEAGRACDTPVISTDFYPTLLELAGLTLREEQHADGVSFAELLRSGVAPNRASLYWHYPHYGNQGGWPGSVVRAGDFKLIERHEDGRLELYDLKNDVGERKNLVEEMPEKAAELRALLMEWHRKTKANMPRPNPDFLNDGIK
ncbi:Arylsulfatase [Pontiella desulfatans]|uniref:Arylsulfatase n=1 Tax=Pontiella desulfatans TaxID=2750659 RepID=A0A6C2U8S9_PONDE|nr:sulfatase [Pontiella desulfatans]SPS74012.1 sulfatase S1_16 [Kiritimatiellales bacterium]VGO16243.1 Arylsulfatase [Pontiella desulfatans]